MDRRLFLQAVSAGALGAALPAFGGLPISEISAGATPFETITGALLLGTHPTNGQLIVPGRLAAAFPHACQYLYTGLFASEQVRERARQLWAKLLVARDAGRLCHPDRYSRVSAQEWHCEWASLLSRYPDAAWLDMPRLNFRAWPRMCYGTSAST